MLLTILTLLSVTLLQDKAAEWVKQTSSALGFEAEFPVTPTMQKLTDKGPDDKEVKITIYRANRGGRSYLVAVSKFSDDYMKQSVETIFDNARNGSIARSGGELESERSIKIGTHVARETIVKAKNAGYVRAWVTVANRQQYAIMVAGKTKDDVTNDDAERFLKAFKITTMKK
jgi:hypothetical protein